MAEKMPSLSQSDFLELCDLLATTPLISQRMNLKQSNGFGISMDSIVELKFSGDDLVFAMKDNPILARIVAGCT